MIPCIICLNTCRIPVRLVCFPCNTFTPHRPNCSNIRRVCLSCAKKYLHLEKKKVERPASVKCLICSTTCNPRYLNNVNDIYEKDFLLMQLDPRDDYDCENQGCSFRGHQFELYEHLQFECLYRMIQCDGCKESCPYKDEILHKSLCTYYVECSKCPEYILKTALKKHYSEVHSLVECNDCHELMSSDGHHQHSLVCPELLLHCDICSHSYKRKDKRQHIIEDLDKLHQERLHYIQKLCNVRALIIKCEDILVDPNNIKTNDSEKKWIKDNVYNEYKDIPIHEE